MKGVCNKVVPVFPDIVNALIIGTLLCVCSQSKRTLYSQIHAVYSLGKRSSPLPIPTFYNSPLSDNPYILEGARIIEGLVWHTVGNTIVSLGLCLESAKSFMCVPPIHYFLEHAENILKSN